MLSTSVLILAAGHGKRMNSQKSKVLHEIGGQPMIMHVYSSIKSLVSSLPIVVVGSNFEEIFDLMGSSVKYAFQDQPLGTGHAAMAAIDLLRGSTKQVVVMYGDMPLIRKNTIEKLILERERNRATIAMISIQGEPSSTFGRVIRDETGKVVEVIEWADAGKRENSKELLAIKELNAGLYCFDCEWFCENVGKIVPRPSRDYDEYYLTDIFRIAKNQRKLVIAINAEDEKEFFGISTKEDLAKAEEIYKSR